MIRRTVLPTRPPAALLAAAVLTTGLLSGCTGAPAAEPAPPGAADRPVTVTSCGHEVTVTEPPSEVVTLNQGATEVVLALGLADQLAGTAYLDDAVPPRWRAAYDAVPVLSAEYPTNEQLLAAGPDFVYASYASAFEPAVAGTQEDLAAAGVGSYLSPFGCPEAGDRPGASFEAVWGEVEDVATALGHPEAADRLRAEQEDRLADLEEEAAGSGLDVVWWDGGTRSPNVGAGEGGPQLVLDAVGADNVFGDLDGSWAEGSWEDVLAADPDVIVLVDAAWDPAADKRAYLESDPVLSRLTAVRERHYAVVPFSESTAGVRLVDGAASLADQLGELGLAG
ncbi:ABC transporter substrate-binding protein [Nocardioides sp. Arc9.136]|uniref:ABC transporter substrate-binding protein n=1 Tax=Nocardioides sp. Arc9.136 TaxID=2996826 RepID=UPI002665DA3E|nr:ABC transporter substrate-binding protein [Nocardioides sp. Arc9.136]WKN48961.1 ABC transporter substrate-binding protein [Nocardioides sp. Arc9.136]